MLEAFDYALSLIADSCSAFFENWWIVLALFAVIILIVLTSRLLRCQKSNAILVPAKPAISGTFTCPQSNYTKGPRKRWTILLALTICDVCFVLLFACGAVLFDASPAYAYVDPSVMTYAIQAFAGVAVALGAVAGVLWRRTRKKLLRLLHIDENARKVFEDDVHRTDGRATANYEAGTPSLTMVSGEANATTLPPNGNAATDTAQFESPKQRSNYAPPKQPQPLRWRERIVWAGIVSAFLFYTVLVVAPFEIVASNSGSLIFGLADVWWLLALAALATTVCLALILSLVRGKAFEIVYLIVFSLGVCAYVQAMFLNSSLPAADGTVIALSNHVVITVISAVVWLVLIAVPLVARHWNQGACRGIAAALSICLVVVQTFGVASLFAAPVSTAGDDLHVASARDQIRVTEDGLFEVSPTNNVIVFVLDTFDTQDLDALLADNPHLLDSMTDFTYFRNTTGSMIPTRYAVPFLLTNELPEKEESFYQYLENRYARSSLLPDISDANYSLGIYSDTLGLEYAPDDVSKQIASITLNMRPTEWSNINEVSVLAALWKCALYRDTPWILKPCFWFYTDEINNSVVGDRIKIDHNNAPKKNDTKKEDKAKPDGDKSSNTDESLNSGKKRVPYTMNDARIYNKLIEHGLNATDNDGVGAFRFIHLLGGHSPFSLDENAQDIGAGNSTFEKQCRGSLKVVEEYLQQMRDLGLYDSATIIITADHGAWYSTMELTSPTSPIMLVKPATSPQDAGKPLQISSIPVSHLDIPATVIDALGEDSTPYGSSLLDVAGTDADTPTNRSRFYYMTTSNGQHDQEIKEYEIDGDALDFSNWHLTGSVWDAQS